MSIHITPCYDKKLEAFRYKLDNGEGGQAVVNDIDLVLSSKEI